MNANYQSHPNREGWFMHFPLYLSTTKKSFFCFQIVCIWGKVSLYAPRMAERRELQSSHAEKLFLFFSRTQLLPNSLSNCLLYPLLATWILIKNKSFNVMYQNIWLILHWHPTSSAEGRRGKRKIKFCLNIDSS